MAQINIENFEDWGRLEDPQIQQVLREVEMEELAVALKVTGNETIAALHRNMSDRAVAKLKETMDEMGSVPIGDVERAQGKILGIMQDLRSKGVI